MKYMQSLTYKHHHIQLYNKIFNLTCFIYILKTFRSYSVIIFAKLSIHKLSELLDTYCVK